MKGLIKNYVDKLTIKDLKEFALKNNIQLKPTLEVDRHGLILILIYLVLNFH